MREKHLTYFVSDVHLGLQVADPAGRERRFADFLKNLLKSINTIDEFQVLVMQKFVRWAIDHTAKNFSYAVFITSSYVPSAMSLSEYASPSSTTSIPLPAVAF